MELSLSKKLFLAASCIGIIGWIIIILVYTLWNTYPYNPVTFKSNYFSTEKVAYKQGETLKYEVDYCKNLSVPATLDKAFINGVIYHLPSISSNIPAECKNVTSSVTVPHVPAGNYRIRLTFIYQVNPIRTITVVKYTNYFQIVE